MGGLAFNSAYMQAGLNGATCVPSRAMLLSGRTLFHIDEKLISEEQGHWLMARTILMALGARDLNGITIACGMFPDQVGGKELLRLIHQQSSVMKDAWLTDIGHKRPQKAGLPLPQAQKQAADIETQIPKLLCPTK